MVVQMTYHAKEERLDRLAECVTVLGMGKIVVQAKDSRYPGTVRQLTATGIVLVFDEESNRLITGYMATVAQMHMIYRQANVEKIPSKLYQRIHKNNDKFSYLHDF
jgi:hypothetical protein